MNVPFIGRLSVVGRATNNACEDCQVIALGAAWQEATSFHRKVPPIDDVEENVKNNCSIYSRCNLAESVLQALKQDDAVMGTAGSLDLPSSANSIWPQAG